MRCVRFHWNPVLIDLRREVCPAAQWQRQGRRWLMSDADAEAFIRAAQVRLDFQRQHTQICVDDITWVVGFVQGAPYRLSPTVVHGQSGYGLPARASGVFVSSAAYDSGSSTNVKTAVRYAKQDLLVSGLLRGADVIEGQPAVISATVDAGRIVLLGFRVQHRAQSLATFRLLFNAIFLSR